MTRKLMKRRHAVRAANRLRECSENARQIKRNAGPGLEAAGSAPRERTRMHPLCTAVVLEEENYDDGIAFHSELAEVEE
jgi:hypothetical protein